MIWHRTDTEPLPESLVIQVNGAYMLFSDWLSWLFHRIGDYIDAEKNSIVCAHEDTFTPIAEIGQFRLDRSGRVEGRVDPIL